MSIRRHTALNMLGQGVPLVLALLTVPTYVRLIGEARYGALAMVWLLISYFGLFDLGLGQACAQRLARLASSPATDRARVFGTALAINLGLGVAGGLLAWPAARWFFGEVLSIEPALRAELLLALPWIPLALPVATLAGVFNGALQSRERFLELNTVAVIGHAGVQLAPLAAAMLISPSLALLIPVVLAVRMLTFALLWRRCRQHVTEGEAVSWNTGTALDLLRFGGWVSISAVVGPIMVVLDRFAIGALMGAREVGYYTVPYQLAERATLLSASLNSALFPRLTVAADGLPRQQMSEDALRLLVVLMSPPVAFGMLLVGPFLSWWVSPELAAASGRTAQVLLVGFWVNSLAMVPYTQLHAAGRPGFVAKCHLVEVLPYLGLLYLGLKGAGLVGAASVFALRAGVDFLLLGHFSGVLRGATSRLLWPACALLLLLITQTPGFMPDPWPWIIAGSVCGLLLAWCAVHAPVDWRRVRSMTAGAP